MRRIRNVIFDDRFRVVGGLAALVLFVLILWPRPQAGARPGRPDVLVYWRHGGMNDIDRDALEQFERNNPTIEVIAGNAAIRNATDDPQRFLTGVAGGAPPDVIFFDRYAVAEWASRGAFEPLDGYMAADRRELQEAQQQLQQAQAAGDAAGAQALAAQVAALRREMIDPSDFYEATWDKAHCDRHRDGHPLLYGVPAGADNRALYYNEARLTQEGLVDDAGNARPPRTWEEILTRRLEASDGGLDATSKDLLCDSEDFVKCGVQKRDHISMRMGTALRTARVEEVVSPHELKIRFRGRLPARRAASAVFVQGFRRRGVPGQAQPLG